MTDPQANLPTYPKLLEAVTELGTHAGLGTDTQIKFDVKVAEAAYLNVIDTLPNKHGTGINDATTLAAAYVKARDKAVIFDAKAPNQRKLVSNVQKLIKLMIGQKWGTGEPLNTMNALINMWQNLRKSPGVTKINDAHNTVMRWATAQMKSTSLFVGDDLKAFCYKKQSDPLSGEEVLENIRKLAGRLKTGTITNCPDMDNSKEVQDIIANCTKRLTAIAKAKGATP